MALFNISPINSLSFIKRDDLAESFANTPYQDIYSLSKKPYCQMINVSDKVTIQVKTDYTAVTATLYNVLTNTSTTLTPVKETTYTLFSFWEIPITFTTEGYYKIFIGGTLSGYATASFESEMIQVKTSWGGLKIDYYNSDNTAYVDYSNNLTHMIRVDGIMRFSDVGGEEDFYDNQGTQELVNHVEEEVYDLAVEDIPYYLVKQLIYASKVDNFLVNDVEYLVKEHSKTDHPGSHNCDLMLKLTRLIVPGINGDDEDFDV